LALEPVNLALQTLLLGLGETPLQLVVLGLEQGTFDGERVLGAQWRIGDGRLRSPRRGLRNWTRSTGALLRKSFEVGLEDAPPPPDPLGRELAGGDQLADGRGADPDAERGVCGADMGTVHHCSVGIRCTGQITLV